MTSIRPAARAAAQTDRLVAGGLDVDAARRWIGTHGDRPVRGCAHVIVDGSGPLGALSYTVPDDVDVVPGDAVEVPLGRRQAHGMVLGPGDPAQATRPILHRWGKRASAAELATARLIASRHFVDVYKVAERLSPRQGRGADPVVDRQVELDVTVAVPDLRDRTGDVVDVLRRFAARPPGVDQARFAAAVACQLAADGQVLVLCPTVELVSEVTGCFTAGARRIDTKADDGAWRGFTEGTVRVGVGTRTAALYSATDLAAVVVVEQDHPGHVELRMPNTHTRDVALLRSVVADVPVVFTGVVPTPPALTAGVKLRETDGGWPNVSLVSRDGRTGRAALLPPQAITAVTDARDAGIDRLVLAPRARASHRCERCGATRRCADPDCATASTCDREQGPCPTCQATAVRPVGWDPPRLDRLFNGVATTVTPAALRDRAADPLRPPALVVVFDVDTAWRRATFDPDGDAARMIAVAAEAAGPDGHLLVLTNRPDEPILQALCVTRSARAAALHLWGRYHTWQLPPFGRLVTVDVLRRDAPQVDRWPGQVLGPRRTADGWQVLVRISPDRLPDLRPHIERLRGRHSRTARQVRVTVS